MSLSVSSRTGFCAFTLALFALRSALTIAAEAPPRGYLLRPVPFDGVTLSDQFWRPRLQTQRRVLVPYAFRRTEEALSDLRAAAELLSGRKPANPPPPHRYRTSDLF